MGYITSGSDIIAIEAIRQSGFDAAEMLESPDLASQDDAEAEQVAGLLRRALVSGAVGFPLMALGMAGVLPEMSGGGRGFIALVNENGDYTIVTARSAQKVTIAKPEEKISDTVIRESLKLKNEIQLDANAFDENLMGKSSIIRSGIHALICVPVFVDHQVCGIVYLDQFPW